MTDNFKYQGDELELFQHARNWKKYFSAVIKPYNQKNVLEVGAGIGSTTLLLNDGSAKRWLLLEPDAALLLELKRKKETNELPANCSFQSGTVEQLNDS